MYSTKSDISRGSSIHSKQSESHPQTKQESEPHQADVATKNGEFHFNVRSFQAIYFNNANKRCAFIHIISHHYLEVLHGDKKEEKIVVAKYKKGQLFPSFYHGQS